MCVTDEAEHTAKVLGTLWVRESRYKIRLWPFHLPVPFLFQKTTNKLSVSDYRGLAFFLQEGKKLRLLNRVTGIGNIPAPEKKGKRKKWVRTSTDVISGESTEMADGDISFKGKKSLLDHSSLTSCIMQVRKFHLVTPVELADLLIYSRREFGSPLFERSVDFLPRR